MRVVRLPNLEKHHMTDDQFKQLIAAIEALQKHLEENDNSTKISSIETEVEQINKDIREIKKLLTSRN